MLWTSWVCICLPTSRGIGLPSIGNGNGKCADVGSEDVDGVDMAYRVVADHLPQVWPHSCSLWRREGEKEKGREGGREGGRTDKLSSSHKHCNQIMHPHPTVQTHSLQAIAKSAQNTATKSYTHTGTPSHSANMRRDSGGLISIVSHAKVTQRSEEQ